MKQLIQLGLVSSMLLSSSSFAINPIQGFYLGIMGEVSHGPSDDQIHFIEDNMHFTGTAKYSSISGGGGGMLGYKFRQFRVEAELLYNRISTGPLVVGSCTLQSENVLTPTGVCPQPEYDHFKSKALGYNGSSAGVYGLINAYWDFFSFEGETLVVPYIGVGYGRAQITNRSNFVNTVNAFSHGQRLANTSPAYQGIVGLSYYMDDFTWAGMDYRYLSTGSLPEFQNKSYALNTLNFTINFAFDKGGL